MKRNGKSIILSIFLVVSVITAIPLFNLAITDSEPSLAPKSAALQDDLGVRVGDMIYYRVFSSDMEIPGDGPLPQGMVMEYQIQSIVGDNITYDREILYPNGTLFDTDYNEENYTTYQVFGHMFQLTNISDYATASGIDVEDLDQAWKDEINSSSMAINNVYDSTSNSYYHILDMGGYVDDNYLG